MKVVLTGGGGALGRAVVAALRGAGHDVVAPPRADVDLTSDAAVGALRRLVEGGATVVHLAAMHPADPALTTAAERRALVDVNVHGTMRVLEACRDGRARRIVFASTVEVVGDADGDAVGGADVDESSRVSPLSDFAATKLAGEDHLRVLREECRIPWLAVRLAALYGPGVPVRAGLMAYAAAAAGARPVALERPAGHVVDVVHVADAARALVLAAASDLEGVVAVGDGERRTAGDLARAVHAAAGLDVAPEEALTRPDGEAGPRRFDVHTRIDRARRDLGFAPAIRLADGLGELLDWIRRR